MFVKLSSSGSYITKKRNSARAIRLPSETSCNSIKKSDVMKKSSSISSANSIGSFIFEFSCSLITRNPNKIIGGHSFQLTYRRSCQMLAILLMMFYWSGVKGQNFTSVPYNFPDKPLSNNNGYNGTTLMGMQWTAANGYGIWGVLGTSGNWVLMSNELQNENSTSASTTSPSGVVAEGSLGYEGINQDIKVAANLQGQVRYVWPDESTGHSREQFVVKGFNNVDIHINFAGIPTVVNSRNIIYTPINATPVVPTSLGHNVPTINLAGIGEIEWADFFDIAMDAKYLYIVWETYSINTDQTKNYQIWATAQLLTSPYTIAFGPQRIDGGTDVNNGSARRPTVACDVRNSPSSPTFDVAFLTYISDPGQFGAGSIAHSWVHNGVVNVGALNNLVLKNTVVPAIPVAYTGPVHARMMVSSVPGVTIPVKGIYGIVYSPGNIGQNAGALIFHKIYNNTISVQPYAWYVDGADSPPLIKNSDHEMPLTIEPGSSDVVNKPIQAFANPYDGTASNEYDEFHCIYTLNTSTSPVKPLLIVRGFNNPIFAGISPRILNKTRTGVTSPWQWDRIGLGDPSLLVGCVNQMGIHTYWEQSTLIVYSRDLRSFDENIEENTLVTDTCIVSDGSSSGTNHGGTVGATLQAGKMMTLWTDPNFGVGGVGNLTGVYVASHSQPASWRNARISLVGDGVTLDIAGSSGAGNQARLIALPNFQFQFLGTNQSLIIHSSSLFDYYGLPNGTWNANGTGPVVTNFSGTGTIKLLGGSVTAGGTHDPPTALSAPAGLNIHGGANFKLPETISFVSTNSLITILSELSIMPVNNIPSIVAASGIANFHGPASFTSSWVYSQIPSGATASVLNFNNCIPTSCTSVATQLTATNSLFKNTVTGGFAVLDFGDGSKTDSKQIVDGGKFDGVGISIHNPTKAISIQYPIFTNIQRRAIEMLQSSTDVYDNIFVGNCDFQTFGANADAGIFINGFTQSLMVGLESDYTYHPRILLASNTFTTTTGNQIDAAIHLENSNVSVQANQVTKNGYNFGILNFSSGLAPLFITTSFFCSNTLANLAKAGIKTSSWKGYSKLNDVNNNTEEGHLSDGDILGAGVDFCNYHENIGPGLKITNGSQMDISGLHIGGNDYPANNTFANNNTQSSSSTSGQIEIASGVDLKVGTTATSFSTYGKNNFVGTTNTDYLIYGTGGNSAIGGLAQNFWGFGAVGTTPAQISPALTGTSDVTHLPNITYSNPSPAANQFSFSGVSCGVGFNNLSNKGKNSQPLSRETTTISDSSECMGIQDRMWNIAAGGDYQQMDDSSRYAIEHCATYNNLFPHIWADFGSASTGVQYKSTDPNRFPPFREWLKKVLYLNRDTNYYCHDILAIFQTFTYFNAERGLDQNGALAVAKFLIDSNRCQNLFSDGFNKRWKDTRLDQHQRWRDTVMDSIKTPFATDTTLPTLEDLDLQILRGPQYAAVKDAFTPSKGTKITYLTVSENPFKNETTLRFGLRDAEYMRIDIYDLLGNKVYSDSKLFGEGAEEWKIDGKSLARGSLYARLSTMSGEVKTVKLVHEK